MEREERKKDKAIEVVRKREITTKNFGRGRSILHSCIEERWL